MKCRAKWSGWTGLAAALVALLVLFHFLMPGKFLQPDNLEQILRQSTVVCLAAIGMSFVIIGAGIDLSVGSAAALSSVAVAWILMRFGVTSVSPLLAAVGGILVATCVGTLNGTVITKLKVGPFVATLGTLLIVRGLAKGLADNQKIDAPITWLTSLLARLPPDRKWMLVAPGIWLTLLCAVLASFLLNRTRFGRHVRAVGGNEQASRYAGLPVDAIKVKMYALCGLFTGLAGVMLVSRLTVGDPTVASGLELDVIAAVVIGGASLSGGSGSIWGSLLGAVTMQVIRSGTSQYGLAQWIQEAITGTIIIVAIALDRFRRQA